MDSETFIKINDPYMKGLKELLEKVVTENNDLNKELNDLKESYIKYKSNKTNDYVRLMENLIIEKTKEREHLKEKIEIIKDKRDTEKFKYNLEI